MKETGMQPPTVVRMQLGVPQLRALIPEGSEAEVALVVGVVENYAKSIADRISRRLEGEREKTIGDVVKQLEHRDWHSDVRPAISQAAKAQIAAETKATLTRQIAEEVRRNLTESAVAKTAKEEVLRQVREWVTSFDIRGTVRSEIQAAIKVEVSKLSLKDLLK